LSAILDKAALLVSLAALLAGGCAAHVGDGCATNQDCATAQFCDTSPPGGYCTVVGCRANSCPSEAWCATALLGDHMQTYCLRKCEEDGNCRAGYVCRFDMATPGGVCFVAPVPAADGGPSAADGGTADAGTPAADGGTADAGTPAADGGTADAGAPAADGGTADAGAPAADGGTDGG
jgi:hypothetical protein